MKKAALFLGILFVTSLVTQAQEDIFKKHGITKEPLTLSKGKYKETFYNEEVMQVGTVLINTLTNKVVKFLDEDTTKFAYRAETTSRFLTVDPLAEEYYSWSPYVYVGNNPIKRTDPTGMDWYEDEDGSYQFNPELNKKNQADILKDGQKYLFANKSFSNNGKLTANYRADGSILFGKESDALQRMITNTAKTGEEEMVAFTSEGSLVLPSYKNKGGEVDITDYNYSSKNGNLVDASGKVFQTDALAHTHPTGGGPTGFNGDGTFMAANFPNKPNYVFQMRGGELNGISLIISNNTRPFSWRSGYSNALINIAPFMTSKNILNGKYPLRNFTRQNIQSLRGLIPKK